MYIVLVCCVIVLMAFFLSDSERRRTDGTRIQIRIAIRTARHHVTHMVHLHATHAIPTLRPQHVTRMVHPHVIPMAQRRLLVIRTPALRWRCHLPVAHLLQ